MRLIDADEFKRQIAVVTIANNYSASKANSFCKLIDAMPTAYNMIDVLNQLRLEIAECERLFDEAFIKDGYTDIEMMGKIKAFKLAIHIVKEGANNESRT